MTKPNPTSADGWTAALPPEPGQQVLFETTGGIVDDKSNPIFYFLRKYRKLYSLTVLLSIGTAVFESLNIGMILPLLASLFDVAPGDGQSGRLMSMLNRAVDLVPIGDKVIAACVLLIALSLAKFVVSVSQEYVAAYMAARTLHETKQELLRKYCSVPYSFFLEHKLGDLKHVVLVGTQLVSDSMWMIATAIAEVFKIIVLLALLMALNVQITLVVLAVVLIFYLVIGLAFRRISHRLGQLFTFKQMELTNVIDELLTGIKHIFIFRVPSHWLNKFDTSSEAQVGSKLRQRLVESLPKDTLELGIMILFFGATLAFRLIDPKSLVRYLPLMGLVGIALMKLLQSMQIVSRTRLKLMHQLPEVQLVHRALTAPVKPLNFGDRVFSGFEDSIQFDGVYFAYSNRPATLRGVNVSFKRSQMTAIVGRSGEGKTTLINLLVGLYEPQRGVIRVDGVDLRQYSVNSWRAQIGFVSQDPFVIHATVAENIAFGDETYTREQTIEAACVANAHEFIEKLPQGYDTVVGERGMKLSGGEQQRISIARAVLRKPEILIFDEATSALDNVSEKLVQEAISRISENRTVLMIAHRLSTVQKADKILVLHDGTCVEEGTHDQLMGYNGYYSSQVRAHAL